MKEITTSAVYLAQYTVEAALAYFKANKNFGAITAINRKNNFKDKLQWISDYSDKKSIDKQQFIAAGMTKLAEYKQRGVEYFSNVKVLVEE